ncbi:HAMP domain-containing sensor histidine kinase [Sphingopyxis sp. KK2]|uniref:sensor histidine kinase n=1 Tax=Sphingopyxis sp. KK2 TaxID=1855727 RepID=UPI00097E6599|nr:HAMP domain-containing sensor histidine kinase [Sphingopyxis sp. KK2]
MRFRPPSALNRSLSLRLLLFAGVTIALAMGVAWLALGLLFERHSERQLQAELERQGIALVAALDLDMHARPVLTRRLTDPRFDRPGSGLYWRASAPAGELRSRSLWDGTLPPPPSRAVAAGWTAFAARGPFEDRVLVVARTVRLDGTGPAMLVEIAADRRPVAAARADFGAESGLFLLLLWMVLALAAWVQVRLGLRPLRAVESELGAMSGAIDARLSDMQHPREIEPLTRAINDFADRRTDDIARARKRARDLAHALKTPITALRMQIEGLDEARRAPMAQSLSMLAGAVEGELARTGEGAQGETAARALVERILAVVSRTPDGAELDFRNMLPADLILPMREDAAIEALGALIDNAARHAATLVVIATESGQGNGCRILICDDGPGIAEALRPAALGRGVRLDERGARHGLGLAIAQDFVTASGGTLALDTAPQGGLCVRLAWNDKG